MSLKIVYIAGKVNGEPIYECTNKFVRAKVGMWRYLPIQEVAAIINPLNLQGIHFGISDEDAMKICLDALSKCTHALFLKDWQKSKGAKIEHQFCLENNIEIIYEK